MKALLFLLLTSFVYPIEIVKNSPEMEWKGYNNCDSETNGEHLVARNFIRSGSTVFDLGANIGEWSSFVLSLNRNIKLEVFEPVPCVFQLLSVNIQNPDCRLNNFAVGKINGSVDFIVYDNDLYWTKLSTLYRRGQDVESLYRLHSVTIKVPITTLDKYCIENNIETIDYLKIDTEGAELDVLLGSNQMITEKRIKYIQFEYGGNFQDSGATLKQVFYLLHNYEIYRIYEKGLIHIYEWNNQLENYCYCNYFAILKN